MSSISMHVSCQNPTMLFKDINIHEVFRVVGAKTVYVKTDTSSCYTLPGLTYTTCGQLINKHNLSGIKNGQQIPVEVAKSCKLEVEF